MNKIINFILKLIVSFLIIFFSIVLLIISGNVKIYKNIIDNLNFVWDEKSRN